MAAGTRLPGMRGIGVVGGYGAVGRAVVDQLRAWQLGPVVVAGRDRSRAEVVLDIADEAGLRRFLGTVGVLVDCTSAPAAVRAGVVERAAAAGVATVDPGGDEPVHALLAGHRLARPAVLSAGMWPGLTGLLPRRLAPAAGERVVCYAGGQDRFSLAGAADYLAAMAAGAGRRFAVWRNGSVVEGADVPALDGDVAYFGGSAVAVPYLGPELERVAADLDVAELVAYTVLPGGQLREALAASPPDAAAVVRASELDLFGRRPYQRLAVTVGRRDAGTGPVPVEREIVLTGTGAAALTGAMAALSVAAVVAGDVPPGLHYAADVLDPVAGLARLRSCAAVTELRIAEPTGTAPGRDRTRDDRAAEDRAAEDRAAEDRAAEDRAAEDRAAENRAVDNPAAEPVEEGIV